LLFSSNAFLLLFLPVVLILYYLFFFSRTVQNILLLAASLVFYAWGEPRLVAVLIGSVLINTLLGLVIDKSRGQGARRAWMLTAVILNLGTLVALKQLGELWEQVGMNEYFLMDLPRPIGIAFFTLQAVSYVTDVYRGEVKAGGVLRVGLHIAFFPKLLAGPLMSYGEMEENLRDRRLSFDRLSLGFCRFVVGLAKKVLLAECFAAIADHVFNWTRIGADVMAVPASLAWLGSIAFSLQIYFDFSAYTDMAIGLGLCFGFKLPENLNYPYAAASLTDFWKRWHITLTDWFRRYVYFPLGGSRVENRDVMVRNRRVLWLLIGLWHGAEWTCLFWALAYFALLLAESFTGFPEKLPGRFLKHLYTLLVVNLLWVVFRSESLFQAGRYFLNMFALSNNGVGSDLTLMFLRENWLQLLLGVLFCTPAAWKLNERMYRRPEGRLSSISTVLYPLCMLALLILCVCVMANTPCKPFFFSDF
jgi:alginate O-acetyltransferase complex protein AlgI